MRHRRLILFFLLLYAPGFSFGQQVSLFIKDKPLEKVLESLELQTGYTFFYSSNLLGKFSPISIQVKKNSLSRTLDQLFSGKNVNYSIIGKTVVIKADTDTENKGDAIIKVTGQVVDGSGAPLPGVSIAAFIGGQKRNWTTQTSGNFFLSQVPSNTELIFSYIGYRNRRINIKDEGYIKIALEQDDNQLNEVQITAYSSTSRRLNTGNSFTIRSEELESSPVPNVLQMIQNKVPGLQITQKTGQVGGSFEVKIRGINGLNSVDPLYVVDGVSYPAGGKNLNPNGISGGLPMLENNRLSGTLAQLGGNALNYLNPADIASIDVLKDADATSIYGSRGAYGVILITTKKGSLDASGHPTLSLVLDRGLSMVGTFPKLLGIQDYTALRKEALKNDGQIVGPQDLDLNGNYPSEGQTDWARELLGKLASSTRIHARFSGGQQAMNYSIVGSFNNQENVVRSKGENSQGGVKMDLSTKTKNGRFEISTSTLLDFTVNTMVPYDFTGDPSIFRAPNAPSYFESDGSLKWINGMNPLSYLNVNYRGMVNNLIATTNLIYRPLKGLIVKTQAGYNLISADELRQVPSTVYAPTDPLASDKTNSSNNKFGIRTWTIEPFINYSFRLAKGLTSLTAGVTFQDKLIDQTVVSGTGFSSDSRLNNPTAAASVTNRFNRTDARYLGYFTSLNYNWSDKYIISGSVRYDGSTKFAPENRFGWFGSLAGSYIFSQEKFIHEHLPFLSFGKLRASYGTSGGDGIDNFLYLSTYSILTDYLGELAYLPNGLANKSLKWEKNSKKDISLSLGFLQDRLIIDAGYYHNTASSLLYGNPVSTVTGFPLVVLNSAASIENAGFEWSITTQNAKFRRLRWHLSAALTVPKTRIIALSDYFLKPDFNFSIGQSPLNVKVFDYQGVNSQTGAYDYKTANGEIVSSFSLLNNSDRTVNIDLVPKYYGSITNTLNLNSFSLELAFSFVNKMAKNLLGQAFFYPGIYNYNPPKIALDRWQAPGDLTTVPKSSSSIFTLISARTFGLSSGAYQRIYYARLQNISLNYKFPKTILDKYSLRGLSLALQAQNLFTITNYKDLDPENAAIDQLPMLRVFNVKLALTF